MTTVSRGGVLERGCGWEIAKVKVTGVEEAWWSLGFEAFGPESGLRDTLFPVAEYILSAGEAPSLGLDDSSGYPRWLRHVAAPIQ
jgi:hypothetical protein